MSKIEEILARDGKLVYRIRGVSMNPMLVQNRDLVVIRSTAERLKKYDVALYKRGDEYVLHRVIKVKEDCYLIRGDNTFSREPVSGSDVIGVLTAFVRNGKTVSVTNRAYKFYARFWNAVYPVRFFYRKIRRLAVKTAQKIGLLPFIRKVKHHGQHP